MGMDSEYSNGPRPTAVYRRFLDALNAQDLKSAETCVDTERYRENCVGFTPGWVDWPAACSSLAPIWKAIPDLHVEVLDLAEAPGIAMVRGVVSGTATGRLYGAPATKRSYRASYFDFVRVEEGLITERVQQADIVGQMRQLYRRFYGVIGISALLLRQTPADPAAPPR
jgi:predicted ester cyclase